MSSCGRASRLRDRPWPDHRRAGRPGRGHPQRRELVPGGCDHSHRCL